MVAALKRPLGSGEPFVTAVWKSLSVAVLVLTVLIPVAAAVGNRHWSDIPLVILALYTTAFAASCLYNKMRYGRTFADDAADEMAIAIPYDSHRPPHGRRPRRKRRTSGARSTRPENVGHALRAHRYAPRPLPTHPGKTRPSVRRAG